MVNSKVKGPKVKCLCKKCKGQQVSKPMRTRHRKAELTVKKTFREKAPPLLRYIQCLGNNKQEPSLTDELAQNYPSPENEPMDFEDPDPINLPSRHENKEPDDQELERFRQLLTAPGNPSSAKLESGEDPSTRESYSAIQSIAETQAFIDAICNATYNNGNLIEDTINLLQNPATSTDELTDPDVHMCLEILLGLGNASETCYTSAVAAI
ncbi:hypothetical protein K435DRAFT_797234 [Dendrothele bispora CBS 962.96]|uniref:Uncharacterized protein n=1 Tax=Dendrothele bispora (strain CBS 962.96) TaxID=1314807 RepID=A0A4V4HFX4_DENBC|nr:hypothetical protein K435DRAFT_797234 [Dendrothele bispora CBS 962.96]